MTSEHHPKVLLALLERAQSGGLLGPAPEDDDLMQQIEELEQEVEREEEEEEEEEELEEDEELELEEDDEELEDEFEEYDDDEAYAEEDEADLGLGPEAGPEPTMRTSPKGEQALYVAFILKRWLANCPAGPLEIGPSGAGAIALLVCGWSATVTHALAGKPRTMKELDQAVEILSFDTVREHVLAMVHTGLVDAWPDAGRETRYAATKWLREGIAPLAASARFERLHSEPGTAPPDRLDVEAAFQLALPLLKLPPGRSGTCRLAVRLPGEPPSFAGATAEIGEGRVISSTPSLEGRGGTQLTGSTLDWLDTLVEPRDMRLHAEGDLSLIIELLSALHAKLFGVPEQ
jgi:hypothetical protein